MYGIKIGEISEARMRNWRLDDDNPFDVIEGKPILEGVCTIDGVLYCQECLREEVDVDWGSSAFKGNASEIEALLQKLKWQYETLDLEDGKDYAIVFIEECW